MSNRWLVGVVGALLAVNQAPAQSLPPSTVEAPVAEKGSVTRPDLAPIADGTGDGSTAAVAPAQPGNAFWFQGDYLLWKVKGASVPTLVGQIPRVDAEFIQQFSNTFITPLFGGSAGGISYDAQSGVHLETGLWLDSSHQFGLSVGYFQLEQGQQRFAVDSQSQQALGPVFYRDAASTQEAVVLDGVPGLREGTVSVDANQHLWGTEVNGMYSLSRGGFFDHFDLLAGFRYMQFSEGLAIRGTSRVNPGGILPCGCYNQHLVPGTTTPSDPTPDAQSLSYSDDLGVHNDFYAPQIGLSAGASYSGFFVETSFKLGLGAVHAEGKAEGSTTQQSSAGTVTQSGGILAPPGGLDASSDRFTVIPEFAISGGYQLTTWCRAMVGYDFLYASDVVRVSSLVGSVDARQVPQLSTFDATVHNSPSPHLQGGSFRAQGLTAGLEFRY